MKPRIAATDCGTYFHHESLRGARYAHFFDRLIYMPQFGPADCRAWTRSSSPAAPTPIS
jgi:hypothetical protein